MATTKKKPGPKHIEFDYDAVAFFCRSQISDAGLARKLHVSPQLLAYHLNKDPKLREARAGGTYDGKNFVSDAMFKKMMDRYLTFCKDCEKIRFSFDKFYDKCPYCDASRPVDPVTGKDEFGNDHTNVTHKFIPGDTSIMIHWSKKHLDMNDRIIHEGNTTVDVNSHVAISSLPDEDIRQLQAIARRAGTKPRNGKKTPA